ncbi:MAG: sn-glycerol-3-phosphate transporter [Betaproteobacteria bacterium]
MPFRRYSDPLRRSCVLLVFLISLASAAAAAQDATTERGQAPAVDVPATAPDEPWRTDRIYLETSLNNTHFHYDPAHSRYPKLVYGEYHLSDRWLVGAAAFDNSFGQASQAVFGGWRYRPLRELQPLYLKVVAGIVHGYRGQYRDKIPLNHSGFAPAIIPSVGYCVSRVCSEMVVIGGAGVLFTFGVTIP